MGQTISRREMKDLYYSNEIINILVKHSQKLFHLRRSLTFTRWEDGGGGGTLSETQRVV